MSYSLVSLPEDYLFRLSLSLSLSEIHQLSLTNKKFNRLIGDNDYFWRHKFRQDYAQFNYIGSWKKLYQDFFSVWGVGILKVNGQAIEVPTLVPNIKVKQVSVGFDHVVMIDFKNNCWLYESNS